VTVDPHLDRHATRADVYSIPAAAVRTAPVLAARIGAHVADPLVVGPDAESAQWADAVARALGAPALLLDKVRRGDRDVELVVPDVARWTGHTPALVGDILSPGGVVTTNTIPHPSSAVDVTDLIAGGARDMLGHG
jgi:ribose-phosphate pyrophosphokinase